MTLEKSFDPKMIEKEWYEHWEKNDHFVPQGDGESYCIMIPPPNVTGSLHMGHAFQQTLMDVLIRYQRMKGKRTLWLVGTDHAGIATQMVVERQLAMQNVTKHHLGRDAFVEKIWEWKHESGGNITRQLRRLGASVDWSRERFTMDEGLSKAVIEAFVKLYDEGLIYRGKRLVNWDPVLLTAVSDLEVESEEEAGFLYYIHYPHSNGKDFITVATTRPETLLGDVAVAVHPDDDRYNHLIGTQLELPLCNRLIPIIADKEVAQEFGTGCVKITPAHDFSDYLMGERHHLPKINIFNPNATLNENAPEIYRGLDRYKAREKIIEDLKTLKLLDKIENHKLNVPRGDRSGAVLEPMLMDQWFVKIKPLAKPAIDVVENNKIEFVPENWKKTYYEWMRNIQDWCISRQLWWGHRIPAWFDEEGKIYVGYNIEDVRKKYNLPETLVLKQDDDVLDTWFSSALWPFSTLGWPEKTADLKTFYPTNVLITGFDIIFFWVARMIMFGLKFTQEIPFKDVYIHGLIQDQDGQKMSKTKGNVIDPIDLIDGIDLESLVKKRTQGLMQPKLAEDIEKKTRKQFPNGIPAYGTDALRFTFCILATTGRHIRFDLNKIEGYRHFCNKIWNATRYVLMNVGGEGWGEGDINLSINLWIISTWQKTKKTVHENLANYRFDLAAQALYEFTWNEYCDWYLELSKPILNKKPDNTQLDNAQNEKDIIETKHTLILILDELLRALHPFIPYITETLWQEVSKVSKIQTKNIEEQEQIETIMLQPYPEYNEKQIKSDAIAEIDWLKAVVLGIRNIRGEMNIAPNKTIPVFFYNNSTNKELDKKRLIQNELLLKPLIKAETITWLESKKTEPAATALVGNLEILIPMADLIDTEAELKRLQKEYTKTKADYDLAHNKLSNESFVKNAPKNVVEQEEKRKYELKNALNKLDQRLKEIKTI